MWITTGARLAEQLAHNHRLSYGISIRSPRQTYYVGTFDELREAGVMYAITPIYYNDDCLCEVEETQTATIPCIPNVNR